MNSVFPLDEYPDDWPAIAKAVKDAARWQCIRCSHKHDPPEGYCLTVHHLDGRRRNCRWWNLAALCQRCHLRVQNRVKMERPWLYEHSEWMRPLVAGYYAHCLGLPDDREFVSAHVDQLIATFGMKTLLFPPVKEATCFP